jgi:predicted RNase H-like HicB family nuclease
MNLRILHLYIESLPEGVYLATSEEMQGLVAQGRTIQETLDIAQDVASKLMEASYERLRPSSSAV